MAEVMKQVPEEMKSDLIQVDRALESWRDAGFDLSTAIGEVVDNSIEAKATSIRIKTYEDGKKIESIAIADDGIGIVPEILPHVLQMGYSTRYGQRKGLGRFGVGMKLAALSQCKRVDIYTVPFGTNKHYHTFIDLEMIKNNAQHFIHAEEVEGYPKKHADLMKDFKSGTLIVWSNVDRLVEGGKYGNSNQERLQDLTKFLGRSYRKFIDQGLKINLNNKTIDLHDPLLRMESERAIKIFNNNFIPSKVIDEGVFPIDGHNVKVIVTLYPEIVRKNQGEGGSRGEAKQFEPLYIAENQGRISFLRNGREIYYNVVPKMLPTGTGPKDRFIGIEVSFPADLDEYFQVRHVKRGAEPVNKLREAIRKFLEKPVQAARKEISEFWELVERDERKTTSSHTKANEAVKRAEETSPRGRAGMDVKQEEATQIIEEILEDAGIDQHTQPEVAEEIKNRINEQPITVMDGGWPGKELMEITHLNGKAILRINNRHTFIKDVYLPLKKFADKDPSNIDPAELAHVARLVESGIDVLLMAYAKAENMHDDPETAYGQLRAYWGQFTAAYVRELLKD